MNEPFVKLLVLPLEGIESVQMDNESHRTMLTFAGLLFPRTVHMTIDEYEKMMSSGLKVHLDAKREKLFPKLEPSGSVSRHPVPGPKLWSGLPQIST